MVPDAARPALYEPQRIGSRARLWLVAPLVAVAALLAGCADESAAPAPPERSAPAAPPSEALAELDTLSFPAPDFERPTLEGGTFRLSDHRGDVVAVNFWATWCLPCRVETPEFVALQDELEGQGVRFVGVSLDEGGFDDVRPFAEEVGVNYPLVLDDGGGALLEPYGGLAALPTTVLVGRDGTARYRLRGLTSAAQLRPLLQDLAAERPPAR